jgi:hypothetical protein
LGVDGPGDGALGLLVRRWVFPRLWGLESLFTALLAETVRNAVSSTDTRRLITVLKELAVKAPSGIVCLAFAAALAYFCSPIIRQPN